MLSYVVAAAGRPAGWLAGSRAGSLASALSRPGKRAGERQIKWSISIMAQAPAEHWPRSLSGSRGRPNEWLAGRPAGRALFTRRASGPPALSGKADLQRRFCCRLLMAPHERKTNFRASSPTGHQASKFVTCRRRRHASGASLAGHQASKPASQPASQPANG